MILAWIKVLGMAMRLRGFEVKKVGPIKLVAAENLSDIVVLAGPNGVGNRQEMSASCQRALITFQASTNFSCA
jgi:hypothetical protein